MDCRDVENLLTDGQGPELAAEQRAAVAEHIWNCPACREKWGLDVTAADSRPSSGGAESPAGRGGAIVCRQDAEDTAPLEIEAEAWPPLDLGGFEILGRLGHGGMGTVFRARQPRVDRIVALKVLSGRAAWDGAAVIRFTREAQAAAAIGHPNIIEVYDVGQDRGWHYIAMEYVDGGTLADLIRRDGPLAPTRALALMKQVAAALAEAHGKGILHRDVKPSNILLTSRGWVKLADFGLAKRPDVDLSVTRTVSALGTPVYMAPEVLRGESYDARSDLYSLGVTFYEAVVGKPPFTGTTCTEVVAKHLEAEPPALSDAAPDAGAELCGIIHRLLAKSPAERFASASELLRELERVDALSPPRPLRPGPTDGLAPRGGPTARSKLRRILFAVAVLIAVGVGGVCAYLGWPGGDEGPQSLFDGKSLNGWRVLEDGCCWDHGEVSARDGTLILAQGAESTSIVWTGGFPQVDYEVNLEAKRIEGTNSFCHVAFPVGRGRHCFLIVGTGPDGNRACLDRVDGHDSESAGNPTSTELAFDQDRWYRIRLRVTGADVDAWIDDMKAIHVRQTDHVLALPAPWSSLRPFGLGTWQTAAAMRNITVRRW